MLETKSFFGFILYSLEVRSMNSISISSDLVIAPEKFVEKRDGSISVQFYFFSILTSNLVSFGLLLIFNQYCQSNHIVIEKGCCGPEMGFGFLTGILLIIQLRWQVGRDNCNRPG